MTTITLNKQEVEDLIISLAISKEIATNKENKARAKRIYTKLYNKIYK